MDKHLELPSGWSGRTEYGARASRFQKFSSGKASTHLVSDAVRATFLAQASANASHLSSHELVEWRALAQEKDAEIFLSGALHLARRLSQSQNVPSAACIYQFLLHVEVSKNYPAIRHIIESEWAALQGKGSFGLYLETHGSRFVGQVIRPEFLLPVLGGSLAGTFVGNSFTRFAATAWKTPAARLSGQAIGFASEVIVFSALNQFLNPEIPGAASQHWLSASFMLGSFRLLNQGSRHAELFLQQRFHPNLRLGVLNPATTFIGLMGTHHLQKHLGIGNNASDEHLYFDTMATFLLLGAGTNLSERLWGSRLRHFQNDAKARVHNSRPELSFAAELFPVTAGFSSPINTGVGIAQTHAPIMMSSSSGRGSGSRKGSRDSWDEPTELVPRKGTLQPNSHSISHPDLSSQTNIHVEDLYPGMLLDGRYRISDFIGQGGMGVVYRATDEKLEKTLAIKALMPKHSANHEAVERFLREAKAASAIGNAHIIDISDTGITESGSAYFVMEYLNGVSLTTPLADEKAVPAERLIHIGRQIAEAIAAAHHAGIIHRDLKPDNIFLVTQGSIKDFVKVLDFGIAKMRNDAGKKITQDGMTIGTPDYMSPEQVLGQVADHRTDVYSLGVMLYEMATGQVPFKAESAKGVMVMQIYQDPRPISEINPQLVQEFPGLDSIIYKAMAKEPDNRYQSMEELIADLNQLKRGQHPFALARIEPLSEPIAPPRPSTLPRGEPTQIISIPRRRFPWLMGVGLAGGSLTALLALWLASRDSESAKKSAPVLPDATMPDAGVKPMITPIEPDARPSPIMQSVSLKVIPADARVFQNGTELGALPLKLEIENGTSLEIEIRRNGYRSKKIRLNGEKKEVLIRLDKERNGRNPPHTKVKPPVTYDDFKDPLK